MTCISTFSGAGISDLGFERAGFESIAHVEIDGPANNVRKRHFPNAQHFKDIREFDAKQFRGIDAVFGGFPCQDYSVAGQRAGIDGDRGNLWWELHRVIGESGARFIGLENVPGLLSASQGLDFEVIVASLVELGYRVAWRVLNLRYFRVPQRRRRVIIVGYIGDGRAAKVQFEPESLRRHIAPGGEAGEETSGDVAGCLRASVPDGNPDVDTYISVESGPGYWKDQPVAGSLRSIENTPSNLLIEGPCGTLSASAGGLTRPGGNANDLDFLVPSREPIGFQANAGAESNPSFADICPTIESSKASRLSVCEPVAFTCSAQANSFAWERPYYPTLDTMTPSDTSNIQKGIRDQWRVRRLTPREAERLMGLPDDFTRYGADGSEISDAQRYRMLGNGWSVPQAEWMAERIKVFAEGK